MAVAVGRIVAVPGIACNLKGSTTPARESSVRLSLGRPCAPLPSRSGHRSTWRVRTSRNGSAKGLLATRSALQFHVEKDTSGAAGAPALLLEYESLLSQESQEVAQLTRVTIFLVGMMASGKSTVGRILADALGFKFVDSDEVIETFAGGLPVKEIFRQEGESAFRNHETRALQELSAAGGLVVSTGGGAVVRDENWKYMLDGITVWLDVPVEDLAKRVVAVGPESRPLLGKDCENFEEALSKMSKIMAEREALYARADCRLSLRDLASRLQLAEVAALTPTAIAVQVLEEIRQLLHQGKFTPPPIGY